MHILVSHHLTLCEYPIEFTIGRVALGLIKLTFGAVLQIGMEVLR